MRWYCLFLPHPALLVVLAIAVQARIWADSVILTNTWERPDHVSALLTRQVVGGEIPRCDAQTVPLGDSGGRINVGSLDSWRFFEVANTASFTNALFALINTRISVPGTNSPHPWAVPDLDLYVSLDPSILALDPVAIAAADKAITRGATEYIVYTNAGPGPYYLGVKSEQAQSLEFSVSATFSESPTALVLESGDVLVRPLPLSTRIPKFSGTAGHPLTLLSANQAHTLVRRAVVTNVISHAAPDQLVSILRHETNSVTLTRGESAPDGLRVYDDSPENDIPEAMPSSGPGKLADFAGLPSNGLWEFDIWDTGMTGQGTNEGTAIMLETQKDLRSGVSAVILPGASRDEWLDVPPDATNITVIAVLDSGPGPIFLSICGRESVENSCPCGLVTTNGEVILVLNTTWDPPLDAGLHRVRFTNLGASPASVRYSAQVIVDSGYRAKPSLAASLSPLDLSDQALSSQQLYVTNSGRISTLSVGVRLDHPRVSDLVMYVVSPQGTRVALSENRGECSVEGFGSDGDIVSVTPVSSSGGPEASTNVLETGVDHGTIQIDYSMYSLPDFLRVYYQGALLFDSGLVSEAGTWYVDYGPGDSTLLTIVVNEGGNYDPNTAWDYVITSRRPGWAPFVFADRPELLPIKFLPPPFTNTVVVPPGQPDMANVAPEESLTRLCGEEVNGQWTLEVFDTQAGPATNAPSRLLGWYLEFTLLRDVPDPADLVHAQVTTNAVGPGQTRYFRVDFPAWGQWVTNTLGSSSAPVDWWFLSEPPPATPEWTTSLAQNTNWARVVLSTTGGQPTVRAGEPYYLGVHNTNSERVSFTLEADFNVTQLPEKLPMALSLQPGYRRYYSVSIATNAYEAELALYDLSGNASLVARRGLPFPDESSFDAASFNPDSQSELLVLGTSPQSIRIQPGVWYIGVINMDSGPLEGVLLFTQQLFDAGSLQIVGWEAGGGDLCITWNSQPGHSYQLLGKANLDAPEWSSIGSPVEATEVWSTICVPMDSEYSFFKVGPPPSGGN